MKKSLLLFFTVTLFLSCSTFVYYPNGLNAPLLKEKGDTQIALAFTNGGLDIRSAYSPLDHLGVQFNSNLTNLDDTEVNTDRRSGNYYFEGAAGYYNALNTHTIFEAYLGSGFGRTFTHSATEGTYRNTDYYKLYAQLDMGLKWKYISVGLAMREVLVGIYKNDENNNPQNEEIFEMFYEPAIFISGGEEKLKANLQIGFSKSHFSTILSYPFFIMSLGLESRFSLGGK